MKKTLLALCGFSAWIFSSAQCSVDTIPDAWSNSGQCYIDNLSVDANTISSGSGFQPAGVSYQSFASPYIHLRQGEPAIFAIGFSTASPKTVCAWIDYDNNGIYSLTEQAIYEPYVNGFFVQSTVTPPMNVLPDTVHMRITTQLYTSSGWGQGNDDACEAPGIGETEDYMVIIQCASPQSLGFDPAPFLCFSDSVQLTAFSNADVAWYTGNPPTLQEVGQNYYLHTLPGSTDTVVYVQFATPGCFSAPLDSMLITFLPSPVADITGPDTVQSCSAVTFSATPGPGAYSWNTGDTGSTINVNTGFGGYLSLSVSLQNGCYDVDQVWVNIAPGPPATYSHVIPGSSYCSNLELYLNYDSIYAPGTCTWYTYPANTLIGTASQIIYNLTATGTYQFLAIVNSMCGTDTMLHTFNAVLESDYDSIYALNGTPDILGVYTVCYNNQGTIEAVVAGLTGTVYEWILEDVNNSMTLTWNDDDTISVPASLSVPGGLYNIQAILQNQYGCFDTTAVLSVRIANTVNYNVADTTWTCSFPTWVGQNCPDYGQYDILWNTGDTITPLQVPNAGTYTLYTIDHVTGCTMYDTTVVYNQSLAADFFSDTTAVCSIDAYFDLMTTLYDPGAWTEYDMNWNIIASNPYSYDYLASGVSGPHYLVVDLQTSMGCPFSDTTYLDFGGQISFSLGPDVSTTSTPYVINGPAGYTSYNWTPGNYFSQNLSVTATGTYVLTVNNGQQCTASDTIVVNILPMSAAQEHSVPEIKLFPNPAGEMVAVQSAQTISQVRVYDLDGRVVLIRNINATQANIDLSGITTGVYIAETVTDAGTQRSRLVKQ